MRQNESRFKAPDTPHVSQGLEALNYVVPTELVELPSKGMFYPGDHPLYNQEYVEIKHMTAKEEDILTSMSLIEKGVVLDYLIQSLLLNKDINNKSLFPGDRSAIILNARINGYGPAYSFETQCTNCQHKTKVECDLLTIKNKEINNKLVSDKGLMSLELPKTKYLTTIRFLSTYTEELLQREINKKENMGFSNTSTTSFLSFIIDSVNGIKNTGGAIEQFIQNMPSLDAKYIKNKYAENKPDVDFTADLICDNCGHMERREVPLTAQFFWPES